MRGEKGAEMEGRKFDDGKLRWTLLPQKAVRQVILGLMYGAVKYRERNYEKLGVEAVPRYLDAALRHLNDHANGEKYDQESGLPHLALGAIDAMIALELLHLDGQIETEEWWRYQKRAEIAKKTEPEGTQKTEPKAQIRWINGFGQVSCGAVRFYVYVGCEEYQLEEWDQTKRIWIKLGQYKTMEEARAAAEALL